MEGEYFIFAQVVLSIYTLFILRMPRIWGKIECLLACDLTPMKIALCFDHFG